MASVRLMASSRSWTYNRLKLSVTIALITTGRLIVMPMLASTTSVLHAPTPPVSAGDPVSRHDLDGHSLPRADRRRLDHCPQRIDDGTLLADNLADIIGSDLHLKHEGLLPFDRTDLHGIGLIDQCLDDKLDEFAHRT